MAVLLSSWTQFPSENDRLFFRQLEAIFAEYPPSVTKSVTDPLTGMQRKPDYERKRPSVGQIVHELERQMRIFYDNADHHRAKRIAQEQEAAGMREPLSERARAYLAQLKSRDPADAPDPAPPRGFLRRPKRGFRSLAEIAAEWGVQVTKQQIAAVPDAKPDSAKAS